MAGGVGGVAGLGGVALTDPWWQPAVIPRPPTRHGGARPTLARVTTTQTPAPTGPGALAGRTFDAVLFDMDGTLLDSTPAVNRSWLRWAREEGIDPDRLSGWHGVTASGIVDALLAERDDAGRADALERINALELSDTDGVVALPGATETLAALAVPGRSAIVTSSTRSLALARLEAAGLVAPAVVVTASDVSRGKPHPEPFLTAARALGADPARCLVVEDAPAGLEAGRAAGCATLAVVTTHTRGQLAAAPADAVVADLSELAVHVGDAVTVGQR